MGDVSEEKKVDEVEENDEGVGLIMCVVNEFKRKFKFVFKDFKEELVEMKKMKGKMVLNVNLLIEFWGWYESCFAVFNFSRA